MSSSRFSRRAAVAALGAFAAAPAFAANVPAARFRAVQVDVSALRASGDLASAELIARLMPPYLNRAFAPYLAPGDRSAPVLVARVTSLSFGVMGSASTFASEGTMDYIEGEGIVRGAGGRTVAAYPMMSAVRAISFGPEYAGPPSTRRTDELAQSFAQFLPGKMGL